MIKIENTEVMGWEAAIRGMRNPMNSWEKSDSGWFSSEDDMGVNYVQYNSHSDPSELYFIDISLCFSFSDEYGIILSPIFVAISNPEIGIYLTFYCSKVSITVFLISSYFSLLNLIYSPSRLQIKV